MSAADFRQLDKLHLCGGVIWCEHITQFFSFVLVYLRGIN